VQVARVNLVSFLGAGAAAVRANAFEKKVRYLCTFIIATHQVKTYNVSSVQNSGDTKKRVTFDEQAQKYMNMKGKANNTG
jgi:hypothetical protein